MIRTARRRWLLLLAALACALAACGGGSGSSTSEGTGHAVTVKGFAFHPTTLRVQAGTRVTWTNRDTATHTATADGGAFDTKEIRPGAKSTVTLSKAGTYEYHCDIHPTMHGSIVVS